VGMAATPPKYLAGGDLLVTRIAGLGELSNPIGNEPAS
jgi:2-keto-4-pentenoate hydratase/2-oxohepta-3-ene-1,7-dioic acid hydratase in catechol pathway